MYFKFINRKANRIKDRKEKKLVKHSKKQRQTLILSETPIVKTVGPISLGKPIIARKKELVPIIALVSLNTDDIID